MRPGRRTRRRSRAPTGSGPIRVPRSSGDWDRSSRPDHESFRRELVIHPTTGILDVGLGRGVPLAPTPVPFVDSERAPIRHMTEDVALADPREHTTMLSAGERDLGEAQEE